MDEQTGQPKEQIKVKIIQDDLEVDIKMAVIPRIGESVRVFAEDAMLCGEVIDVRWGIDEINNEYGVAIQLQGRW